MGAWGAWDMSHCQDNRAGSDARLPPCGARFQVPCLPGHPPLQDGRWRVGGMAGLGSTGRKHLESCLKGGITHLPVPMAVLEHWHSHASDADSECDRATGCGNALTLHVFVWYLLRAWPCPGSRADQPTPKEPGRGITEVQVQICSFLRETEAQEQTSGLPLPPQGQL